MKYIIALIAFLSLPWLLAYCAAPAEAATHPPVRVVFVNPTGAYPLTEHEQADALAQVQAALTFWDAASPRPPRLSIAGTATITADTAQTGWDAALSDPAWITVAIVQNRAARLLPSRYGPAFAWHWRGVAVVSTTDTIREPDFIAYTTAHELGHALYGLPDTAWDQALDRSVPRLMDYPLEAYRRGALHPDEEAWIE